MSALEDRRFGLTLVHGSRRGLALGIRAARAAAMRAIEFASSHSERALREAGAEVVFSSYADFESVVATLVGSP